MIFHCLHVECSLGQFSPPEPKQSTWLGGVESGKFEIYLVSLGLPCEFLKKSACWSRTDLPIHKFVYMLFTCSFISPLTVRMLAFFLRPSTPINLNEDMKITSHPHEEYPWQQRTGNLFPSFWVSVNYYWHHNYRPLNFLPSKQILVALTTPPPQKKKPKLLQPTHFRIQKSTSLHLFQHDFIIHPNLNSSRQFRWKNPLIANCEHL